MESKSQESVGSTTRHWLAAGAFGAASAYAAVVAKIRSEFYEDVANTPAIKKSRNAIVTEIKKLWDRAPTMSRADYFKELNGYKRQMGEEFDKIADTHHFRSGGWRGFTVGILDRANSMSRNSRRDVIVSASVTAAVATGGALMFFNNRRMRQELDRMNETKPAQEGIAR